MTRENKLTRKLKEIVEKLGGMMVTVSGNKFVSGYPDRVMMHRVWRGLIEIKTKKYACSSQQRLTIEKMWKRCPWGVCVWRLRPCVALGVQVRIEDWFGELLLDRIPGWEGLEWYPVADALGMMRLGNIQCRDLSAPRKEDKG
jgi:hypothetical protein